MGDESVYKDSINTRVNTLGTDVYGGIVKGEIIIALVITMEGRKVVLGMVQAATENIVVCREFLSELIERELRYEEGLLCVVDGIECVVNKLVVSPPNRGKTRRPVIKALITPL